MADSTTDSDTGEEAAVGPGREPTPGTPRWVKLFAGVALLLIVLVVVLLLAGGGQHGPGRHTGSDDGRRTPPAGVTEGRTPPAGDRGGHTPPAGGHR